MLVQDHVTQNIMVIQLDSVIANITTYNNLSFNNEEFPMDGQNHKCALHVSIKCQEGSLARVSIATGSSLNVLQKRELTKLSYHG